MLPDSYEILNLTANDVYVVESKGKEILIPAISDVVKKGAIPTDTVIALLRRKGIWLKWSLMKQGKDDAFIQA